MTSKRPRIEGYAIVSREGMIAKSDGSFPEELKIPPTSSSTRSRSSGRRRSPTAATRPKAGPGRRRASASC